MFVACPPRNSFPVDSRLKSQKKYPAFYVTDASETESGLERRGEFAERTPLHLRGARAIPRQV